MCVESVQCVLVGNKHDLEASSDEGQKVADWLKVDHFITSVKEEDSLEMLFNMLAQALWVDWEGGSKRVTRLHTCRVSKV